MTTLDGFFGEPPDPPAEGLTALEKVLMGHPEGTPERLHNVLRESRGAFERGSKSELMEVVYVCAFFSIALPAWAADAILDVRDGIERGELQNLDEAFGTPAVGVKKRKRRAKLQGVAGVVLSEMARLRNEEGGTPTMADLFERTVQAVNHLGMQVTLNVVRDVYNDYGKGWIKGISPAASEGAYAAVGGVVRLAEHPARSIAADSLIPEPRTRSPR